MKALLLLTIAFSAHATTLDLSSLVINPDGTATLALSLLATSPPAGIGWTLTYSPAQVSAISATTGEPTVAAGKAVSCAIPVPGTMDCVASGPNSNTIGRGTVAYLNVTPVPGATALLVMSNVVAVDAVGNGLTIGSLSPAAVLNQPAFPDGPNLWQLGHSFTSKPVCTRNGVPVLWTDYAHVGGGAIFPRVSWGQTGTVVCSYAIEN